MGKLIDTLFGDSNSEPDWRELEAARVASGVPISRVTWRLDCGHADRTRINAAYQRNWASSSAPPGNIRKPPQTPWRGQDLDGIPTTPFPRGDTAFRGRGL